MKSQRGNVLGFALVLIGVLAALAAAIAAWSSYTKSLVEDGRISGTATCDASYKERDNKELKDMAAKLAALQVQKDLLEAQARDAVTLLQKQLKEKLDENKALADRNNYLTGTRRVRRGAFTSGPCTGKDSSSPAAPATAAPAGNDGTPACDLSQGTKQSVRDIGLRADKTAIQLGACQSLLLEDRKICNDAPK